MKLKLYAEKNNGTLFAVSDTLSCDTVRNGWLFTDIKGDDSVISDSILSAELSREGLFITPLSFGRACVSVGKAEIDVEILPVENSGSYLYRNLPIRGGGYVTGFSCDEDGYLFCRTDIGGCYSSAPPYECWKPLSHNADIYTEWLCNPLAITCKNNVLYALFGNHQGTFMGVSSNKGKSFEFYPVPARAHGNCGGRSTGERIAVTSDGVFIGTRGSGLLFSADFRSWEKISICNESDDKLQMFNGPHRPPVEFPASDDITFVSAPTDNIIVVGTACDCGVFISYDGGKSFSALPHQPKSAQLPFISQRCAFKGDFLFITYSASASDRSSVWYSYACDGSRLVDGRVMRYKLENGRFVLSGDVTPQCGKWGYSGVDISPDGSALVCTTVCGAPDRIYLSYDSGESWREILTDKTNAVQEFVTPYLRHENNNNISVIHWTSDIIFAPLESSCVVINTGTGIFCTRNLGDTPTVWVDFCDGIEETVHLNIYSPPEGDVRVLDVVGDLGGFAFTDIDSDCDFTFRDENLNRYVTALNADFAEKLPLRAVISPRGNWIGTSKGGSALSEDGGISWKQLSDPLGINEKADMLLERIARPNVNPGWVAISCDGETIIRQIADGRRLPADCTFVTSDDGKNWTKLTFLNEKSSPVDCSELFVKIYSDRCDENIFYAFGNGGEIFVSFDKGLTFALTHVEGFIPSADFSSIEGHGAPDIRVSPFKRGEILMFFSHSGAFRLNLTNNILHSERLIPEEDCSCALCGGFGKGKVIFFCGVYKGVYGFYRSYNNDWIRINDEKTQFGQIRSICGDPRSYGRFYIATGSFGSLYGEISLPEEK